MQWGGTLIENRVSALESGVGKLVYGEISGTQDLVANTYVEVTIPCRVYGGAVRYWGAPESIKWVVRNYPTASSTIIRIIADRAVTANNWWFEYIGTV